MRESTSTRNLYQVVRALPGMALVLAALITGCVSTRSQPAKSSPNDKEFGTRIETMGRSYESLDPNRINAFYTPEDYALSFETPHDFSTGLSEHRDVLAGLLANVKELKITFAPTFDTWVDDKRAWTNRDFKAAGVTRKGEPFTVKGWHSAIWEKSKDGAWLIWYEHIGGGPELAAAVATLPAPAPTPAPTPVPKPVVAPAPAPELADIFFDFDKWNIRPNQVATLAANIEILKQYPTLRVIIEGHCDERGGESYNDGLGERRADSTKTFLVAKGIDPSRLQTVSYGKRKPFEQGRGEAIWQMNRRAHFVVVAN